MRLFCCSLQQNNKLKRLTTINIADIIILVRKQQGHFVSRKLKEVVNMVKKMKLDKEDIQQISGGSVEKGWVHLDRSSKNQIVHGFVVIDDNTNEIVGVFQEYDEAYRADQNYQKYNHL